MYFWNGGSADTVIAGRSAAYNKCVFFIPDTIQSTQDVVHCMIVNLIFAFIKKNKIIIF